MVNYPVICPNVLLATEQKPPWLVLELEPVTFLTTTVKIALIEGIWDILFRARRCPVE